MNFEELKKFMPSNGERIILVEDGKPLMVLLHFDDYKENFKTENPTKESKAIEAKRKESKKENPAVPDQESVSPKPPAEEKTENELTLDDLPF